MTTTTTSDPAGLATIALGSRVFVQGVFVRKLDDQRIVVRVGGTDYAGPPISDVERVLEPALEV